MSQRRTMQPRPDCDPPLCQLLGKVLAVSWRQKGQRPALLRPGEYGKPQRLQHRRAALCLDMLLFSDLFYP